MRTEVKEYTTCNACNGRGERRESVSCYDVEWVGCQWCSGSGKRVAFTRIVQQTTEPFKKVVD